MRATLIDAFCVALVAGIASLTAGCGDFVRQGSSPVSVVILSLEAASGAQPTAFGLTLDSDVITNVRRTQGSTTVTVPTVFSDIGRVTMRLLLKDQGVPSVTNAPGPVNEVTFTRYRVTYRRADGRNTPGVDVPFPFDSAATFTVPAAGQVQAGFELVRHAAKEEAPLAALAFSAVSITTLTEVQFFGKDQAGHEVIAAGTIGITFANFGDPN